MQQRSTNQGPGALAGCRRAGLATNLMTILAREPGSPGGRCIANGEADGPPARGCGTTPAVPTARPPGMPAPLHGFILQPTYRVESGRPVIHLYGRLEGGRSFLARDHPAIPHFFVETDDPQRARELGAGRMTPTDRVSLDGKAVSRVEV